MEYYIYFFSKCIIELLSFHFFHCIDYVFKSLIIMCVIFSLGVFFCSLAFCLFLYVFDAPTYFLETAYLNENRKLKKKLEGKKKRFPQYLLCMYVFMYIYLCVCWSVSILQTSSFDIGGWNFNIDIYIKIFQNGIFSFLIPLIIFHYFLYFKAASKPIMKSNTPKWSLGLVDYFYV